MPGFGLNPARVVVGFTGTQDGMTEEQFYAVLALLQELTPLFAHHGDCVGADADFHEICTQLGIPVILHPPTDERKRAFCADTFKILPARPYLERNDDIARICTDLIATPKEYVEQLRSGTWSTVRYSRKYGRRIHLVMPNGKVR